MSAHLSFRLDRRSFLGGMGLTAGAVVASTLVPLSTVHALPSQAALTLSAPGGEGHIDDACGHWPPYAHAIPYSVVRADEATFDETASAPVDYILMI